MHTQALTGIPTYGCQPFDWKVSAAVFAGTMLVWGAAWLTRAIVRRIRAAKMTAALVAVTAAPRIEMVIGDITAEHTDAIVNAAKASLFGGGGVDGAIHKAGGPTILRQCEQIRANQYPHGLPAGKAVATSAGNMPSDYVIHTVGPIYDPVFDRSAILRSCYTEALAVADELGARTVAFPLISSGVYGWPVASALANAVAAVRGATTNVEMVRFVLFDEATYEIAREVEQADPLEDYDRF